MKKISVLFLIIAFALSSYGNESAQDGIEKALKYYKKKNYYSSYSLVLSLYEQIPPEINPYASTELFLMIQNQFYLNNFEKVIEFSRTFLKSYPESKYRDNVLLLKANTLIKQKYFFAALLECGEALRLSDEVKITKTAYTMSYNLAHYYLSLNDLKALKNLAKDEKQAHYYSLLIADKYIIEKDFSSAESLLRMIRPKLTERFEITLFNDFVKELKNARPAKVELGVVLPLSGKYAESGQAILEGIKYAVDTYKKHLSYDLDLVILDNKSSTVQSIKNTEILVQIPNLAAIIGPLTSESAVAMAPICNMADVPLICPTATINELTELGSNIYQLNADIEERGYAMAQFAIDSLKMKTFATLAPSDDFGMKTTQAFIENIENNGGDVVYMGWYLGDPKDIKLQFREMRSIAFELLEADSLDTNNVLFDTTLVLETASDSLKLKLDKIDALYLPVYLKDMQYIAPQMAYWNFDIQLLGDGNFLDMGLLEKYNRYLRGVIFSTNSYWPENDRDLQKFSEDYYYYTGKDLNELNIYGYETLIFLFNVMMDRHFTKQELKKAMEEVAGFRGLIRNLSFTDRKPRANTGIKIIQYKNKKLFEIQ